MLNIAKGNEPDNLLFIKDKCLSLESLPISRGIFPCRKLKLIFNTSSFENQDNGIGHF